MVPMSRITTTRYIRKPLYVDAVRVTQSNLEEIAAWCQGEIRQDEVPGKGTTKKYVRVRVHNPKVPRQTKAFVGDWILYTERGYKVYTHPAFLASFDKAPSPEAEELLMGRDEVIPGVSLQQVVEMFRDGRLSVTASPEVSTEQMELAGGEPREQSDGEDELTEELQERAA